MILIIKVTIWCSPSAVLLDVEKHILFASWNTIQFIIMRLRSPYSTLICQTGVKSFLCCSNDVFMVFLELSLRVYKVKWPLSMVKNCDNQPVTFLCGDKLMADTFHSCISVSLWLRGNLSQTDSIEEQRTPEGKKR